MSRCNLACLWAIFGMTFFIATAAAMPSAIVPARAQDLAGEVGELSVRRPANLGMQASASCTYSLSPSSRSFDSSSASGQTVRVSTGSDCSWTATSNQSWVTFSWSTSDRGNGTVTYNVAANPDTSKRSAKITIADQTHEITQDGADCSYALSPSSRAFKPSGSNSEKINVTAGSGCPWTATSNQSWVTFSYGTSGRGNGTVTYNVAANPDTSKRAATITVADQKHEIAQDAAPCSYSLTPTSRSFYSSSSSWQTVKVQAGARCRWTATSDKSWVAITSGASGSDNGTVKYNVSANPNTSQRKATISVEGQTHIITQSGSNPVHLWPSPSPIRGYLKEEDTQAGSIYRTGVPSSCGSRKACPGSSTFSSVRAAAFPFVNNTGSARCVTVSLRQSSDVFSVAYLGSYNPDSLCSNYLADSGTSARGGGAISYGFNVNAGATFIVVVHGMSSGASSHYNLTVSID